jgi:hypothetical protein
MSMGVNAEIHHTVFDQRGTCRRRRWAPASFITGVPAPIGMSFPTYLLATSAG